MATPGLRFRPPPFALDDPALRWVLLRAFGPVAATAPEGFDDERAGELARELSLAARIAARRGPAGLTAELGAAGAAPWLAAQRAAAARALQIEGLRREVVRVAQGLDITLVLLKFAALEAGGRLLPGSRSASDLDVLVALSETPRLIAALQAAGFATGDEPEQEHQWPTLFRQGVALELHRHLPGVEIPGKPGRFATAPELAAAGALVEIGPGLFRPADPVLGAHLLAHGLAQHGLTPEAYPTLRLFADLCDLGFGTAGDDAWNEVRRWLPSALSPEEVSAAQALLYALEAGRLDFAGPARTLLDHLLAGTFDPAYRQALKLRLFAPPLSEAGSPRAFFTFLRRTVWLTDRQIDDIYGPPRRRWGYAARRLARPLDLVVRSARAAAAALTRRG